MDVWIFTGANGGYALGSDERGANLPEHLGPWVYQKPYRLDPALADEGEAQRMIEEHGFVCF